MVETVLVFPVFAFIMFGVFEFAMLMFTLGESRWSAAEGARVISEQGVLAPNCTAVSGCDRLVASYAGLPCDADCQALSLINIGPLRTTSIASVDEIDITKLKLVAGNLSTDDVSPCVPKCMNSYKLDGTPIVKSPANKQYLAANRGVTLGAADYVEVVIKFHYNWKTGIFAQFPVPFLQATYDVRLEPQRF
jgi:hypothetical protein